ncbi:ComEC/Rec2 family competence protein [Streptomyces shenzhenensis]|uniref:ComEC/Rec2 family competence protein n=1 Tax=Streptomyces shenzhenensis TaxID=943815 RepID=UPI0015F0FB5A|nr:MBL fold metallo-hydrolase [Streptomyces shenzhenensis]
MTDAGGIEGGGSRKRTAPEGEKAVGVDIDRDTAIEATLTAMEADGVTASADVGELGAKKAKKGGGDGKLRISVLDVGQGDCTLIVTPAGKRIMIDCGYSPGNQADANATVIRRRTLWHAINSLDFVGGGKSLDILILTHADVDHINMIPAMLDKVPLVTVYHSATIGHYQNQVQELLNGRAQRKEASIKQVTCKWKARDDKTQAVVALDRYGPDNAPTDGSTDVFFPVNPDGSGGGGITIWSEPDCTVSILASGVDAMSYPPVTDQDGVGINDSDNANNTGSVVTLVEAFGTNGIKALFCGDATRSTEGYLLQKHGSRIENLDFLMVPHHGSSTTSSTLNFIKKTNPAHIVLSAGRQDSRQYQHPRWVTVKRYLQNFAAVEGQVEDGKAITMWNVPERKKNIALPTEQELTAWGIEEVEDFPDVARCLRMDITYAVYETADVEVLQRPEGLEIKLLDEEVPR